jgi:hypothetical protein
MANGRRALARTPATATLAVGISARQKRRPLVNDKNDLRQDTYRNAFSVLLFGIAAELRPVEMDFSFPCRI